MKVIYLCGAINGCTDAEANDWRQIVQRELIGLYSFLDPMRRDYRGKEDDSTEEIIRQDLADIGVSNIVLVAGDKPSWGTAMEVCIAAREYSCFTLTICASDRVSPWLRFHSDEVVRDLAEAITRLREMAK